MIYTDIPTTIYTYIHSENKHIYFYTNKKKEKKTQKKKKEMKKNNYNNFYVRQFSWFSSLSAFFSSSKRNPN